jgi:hypothetical protein
VTFVDHDHMDEQRNPDQSARFGQLLSQFQVFPDRL